jgi:DNA sulfur modification protein DndD
LIWKKETFSKVEICEDYSIQLIHSLGYSCLGTVSAGERELLALAFTLALHDTSGFDAPILIDTPVARISDAHREKFGKLLSEIGMNKQIMLLFTPSEYSDEISVPLDKCASSRYQLVLSSDEKVAQMRLL